MNFIQNNKKTIGLILLAFFLGIWSSGGRSSSTGELTQESHSIETQVWTCSMHPNVQLPEEGQCPICFMDLIPLESGNGSLKPN